MTQPEVNKQIFDIAAAYERAKPETREEAQRRLDYPSSAAVSFRHPTKDLRHIAASRRSSAK